MGVASGAADSAVLVEVTSEGFQPPRVTIGPDRRVVPLNTDVAFELPASSHGELGFQCGMGMYRGKVVAE